MMLQLCWQFTRCFILNTKALCLVASENKFKKKTFENLFSALDQVMQQTDTIKGHISI